MIEIFYGAFYSFIFVGLCNLFVSCFSMNNEKSKIREYTCYTIWTLLVLLISMLSTRYVYIRIILVPICSIFFLLDSYELTISNATILSVLYYGICCVSDMFAIFLYKNLIGEYDVYNETNSFISMLLGVLSQIIVFLVIMIIYSMRGNKVFGLLNRSDWNKLSIFPLFSIIATTAMATCFSNINVESQNLTLLFISSGLLVLNFFVFVVMRDIVKRELQIRDTHLMYERASNTAQLYYDKAKSYEEQRRKEHEYKNHLIVIQDLLSNSKYEKAIDYTKELTNNSYNRMDIIDTNHPILNAIVNVKYKEALEKDICMVFDVCDMSNIFISGNDITVIVSNLLNNALEASEKQESKDAFIKFMTKKENENLIISVSNSYSGKVIVKNGEYYTTKENVSNHGFGIKNVVDIVKKYQGEYIIDSDKNEFRVVIIIPERKNCL